MTTKRFCLLGLVCTGLTAAPTLAVDSPSPAPVELTEAEVAQMSHLPAPELFSRPDNGPSTCEARSVTAGTSVGPDLIVGHVFACEVLGHVGPSGAGTTGMSCWTTACTKGDQGTNWFGVPSVDHPMISVNLFRRWQRDGSDRLEQVGRGWIKHGFGTENADDCNFGCTPGHFNLNGPGCSDTYAASQFVACDLGPRSMIHPYTGVMPFSANLGASGGCAQNFLCNDHRDHVHTPVSHRVQVLDTDLAAANSGARFFSEGQYIVPHEWVDGNGTQNNNVSHRRLQINGPDPCGNVEFVDVGATLAESPAMDAWTGAAQTMIEPAPMSDGRGFLLHKVTSLGGMWRYEYALYNMNMDLSFGSLSIPLPAGAVVTNVGSHFPLNHAPEPHTENYANTPWTVSTTGGAVTWSTTPFATDPFSNAVRWGSMYNFYFDANTPPVAVSATVGLYKSGATTLAAAQGPGGGPVDCNNNTIEDRCDVSCGLPGCSVPGCGTKSDCDANFVPDECEPDCNGNSIADRCDITAATSVDCDANAIPDECEAFTDCNGNLVRDACDVYADPGSDTNDDGVLDLCTSPTLHYWFVDDDAPGDPSPGFTGVSDPLENGTQAHPFDAMQEAIDAASSGDVIVVRDGTYSGFGNTFLTFLGKPVTLRGEHGPASTVVDLESFAMFLDLSRGSSQALRIEGLRIENLDAGQSPFPAVLAGAGASPTFFDCVFRVVGANNGTVAMRLFQNSRATVSHCRFENVRTALETFNGRPTIDNSVILGAVTGVNVNAGDGSTGCITSSSVHIVNSTITGCSTGVFVPAGNFATIENTIIWGNSLAQISTTAPANVTVSYSDIQGGFAGTGNINADPLFLNAGSGDVRLSSASPCIDAGNNGISPAATADQEGGTRRSDRAATVDTGAGSPPIVDIGADEWNDCNGNGADDSVDVDGALAVDCDGNRVPDSCEPLLDCNLTSTQDVCDIAVGSSLDCNVNDIPDECDTGLGGGSDDCNTNNVPDECERDCQYNGVPDDCDITLGSSLDCSGNGVPNECEPDCQPNGIADDCDILNNTSTDGNGNGVPDECEFLPPDILWDSDPASLARATRSVTIQVMPNVSASGGNGTSAVRVRMLDLQNPSPPNPLCCLPQDFSTFEAATCSAAGESGACARWLGPLATVRESQGNPGLGTFLASRLQCDPYYTNWPTGVPIVVFAPEIMPSSTYEFVAYSSTCKGVEGTCTNISPAGSALTRRSGDVAPSFNPPGTAQQPDGLDVVALMDKFRNVATAGSKARTQLQPAVIELNSDVNALDIVNTVDAFRGLRYPFTGPCVCPSTSICNQVACASPSNCSGGLCIKSCVNGAHSGLPCLTDDHCPGGTCGTGFCRDRCGRCRN